MKITLSYQLTYGEPKEIELSPEDYYDPIRDNESYWNDAIEKCNFLHEYLSDPPDRIRWIVARIVDDDHVRLRRAQYLNGDKVMMEHTINEYKEEELILSALLASGEWHTIRVVKPQDQLWSVTVNSLDMDEPLDGRFSSIDLCKNWMFDERKAFCRI